MTLRLPWEDAARTPRDRTKGRAAFEDSDDRYKRLVEQNLNVAYRVARRCGVGAANLDDVLQEVFVLVANKLAEVQPESERAFIVSVTIRVSANWRRTQRRRAEELGGQLEELPGVAPNPEHEAYRLQGLQLLDAAIQRMTAEQREVFILAELEQCTCSEIARQLGAKEAAIVSRLRRARESFDAFCSAFQSEGAATLIYKGGMTHG
jgi:RNA polymerase sigma-70 factor, ECF subfamily